MIFSLHIDTSDLFSQFSSITRENIDNLQDNIAKGLAAGYARQLEQEAQLALHQTRKRYIDNIKLLDSGRFSGVVLLDYSKDPLIKMIEEGASPWDMKMGFLNSAKVKFTKDGRKYLTIPFRHGVPETIGDSDVFANIMPEEVYQVVKNKETIVPTSGGSFRSLGLRVDELPVGYQASQTRPTIYQNNGNKAWEEYQHKSSIYAGLMKYKDGVTGQNKYGSFRRVSESGISATGKPLGSDPDSWINKGINAHNLIDAALSKYSQEEEASRLMDVELTKLGFEV